MPISLKHPTHLSAAHFHAISTAKGGLFASEYKRFKSESHCKDVEEVIQLTEKLVQNNTAENDLFYIREGLKTLRDGYEVTVQKDHPFKSFIRRFFPQLFRKHDQKVKLSLDHMIDEISHKIDRKGIMVADFDRNLVGWIQGGEKEILKSGDVGHENVQRLVRDPGFCSDAKKLIRDISSVGGGSPVDQMKFMIGEIEKLKEQYGGSKIDHRELIYAAIFVGREYVPHLVNQLVKIRDDNYEVVFPPPGNDEMEIYNKYFEFLANGIQYCSQNELAKTVDLLHDKIVDGVDDGFGPWLTGIKESETDEYMLLKSILGMKNPNFLEMVEEMGVFIAFDPQKSPGENLLKLTREFDSLAKRLKESDLEIELTAHSYADVAEAFLVGVGLNSKKYSGGKLETVQRFIAQLNTLLQKVDYNKLMGHTEYASSNIWMTALLPNIKNMSGIDLEGVYLDPPEIKAPIEAKFSDYVRENMGRARQTVDSKTLDLAYLELDKAESARISEFIGSTTFRKEAKSFLKKISRSYSKTPIQEMGKMRMELNRFAVRLNKNLPEDKKIQVGDLDTLLRAAMLSDRGGERVTPLLIKMKRLLQKEPSLLNDDPLALDPVRRGFQQCAAFRNALDFCCRIDPKKLVESQLPQLEKAGTYTYIEMADFQIKETEYKGKVSENLENMNKKILAGEFKSDNKAIYGLIDDPAFVNDARNLFKDFLYHDKWGGSLV